VTRDRLYRDAAQKQLFYRERKKRRAGFAAGQEMLDAVGEQEVIEAAVEGREQDAAVSKVEVLDQRRTKLSAQSKTRGLSEQEAAELAHVQRLLAMTRGGPAEQIVAGHTEQQRLEKELAAAHKQMRLMRVAIRAYLDNDSQPNWDALANLVPD
jgi:hypothetical protein